MKVLWITNVALPNVCKDLNVQVSPFGGWLTGYLNEILNNVTCLVSVFPFSKTVKGNSGNITYYGFKSKGSKKELLTYFADIIDKEKPDVIHIFGTESTHSNLMMKASKEMGMLRNTVVSIQGLVSMYAKHYCAYLPRKVIYGFTLKEVLKRNNVKLSAENFKKQGVLEVETLKEVKNVIGRTDWDEACVKQINPNVNFCFCNESLRDGFYDKEWNLENCEKHSVFVSQASYPIKGFHLMLEGFSEIIKKYPDAKLYTTGKNPLTLKGTDKLKQSFYSKYLGKLIKKYKLENSVEFLGFLSEEKMVERMLKSHVFVSPSSIENSPNSVGEAMILGVPTVSSDVGGVKNMLTHREDGFIYPADEPYMIEYYVSKIFENSDLAYKFSKNAKEHAEHTHNRVLNGKILMEIYNSIK